MRSPTLLLALGALSVAAACAPSPAPSHRMGPEVARERARADSVKYPYTKADVDFMAGMIHHHAQAIVMSRLAPSRGASPALLRLTERIINAQTDEILTMQTWLGDRQHPAPVVDTLGIVTVPNDPHAGHGAHALMPGMATPEQLARLEAARGEEFDQQFLLLMIQHHRGAITMVQALYATPGSGQEETIFKFASDVEVDQSTEIARMFDMLYTSPTSRERSPE